MSGKITLKAARVNSRKTQADARVELMRHGYNVAISTISNWETGRSYPTVKQFQILCDLYGCTMDDIFVS